ncbi:MAG: tyrosine--tRNA ligase [Euryarchaeota archaeon]|nr:tyrosine--tRNA ligase [Euryarchaeota archaeon]
MELEARVALVKEVGEEIVTEGELRALLAEKAHPIAYDGFEPSGTAHIAQGVMRAINVNKMTRAGCKFKMFVADWHAWANNKMGGDLEKIKTTGEYLIEIWRACGMDLSKVEFVWASELVKDEEYWKTVMNIARDSSLDRILRTTQIMGRSEKDKLSAAQILYPCMQAADIFHLKADLTQLGMDQRKVNMLAREVGPKLGFWKPVVVSHHMLMGLQKPPIELFDWLDASKTITSPLRHCEEFFGPQLPTGGLTTIRRAVEKISLASDWQVIIKETDRVVENAEFFRDSLARDPATAPQKLQAIQEYVEAAKEAVRLADREEDNYWNFVGTEMKMSKSNPDSAIFMTDTPEQVASKIKRAFCPDKQATENPILEYYGHIIFERFPSVKIERPAKFGGDLEFPGTREGWLDFERAFVEGKLHPADAKAGATKHINLLLDPVREHFEKNEKARELKAQVESFRVTR